MLQHLDSLLFLLTTVFFLVEPLRWRKGTGAPKARRSHSAEVSVDEMYVFGGTNQNEIVSDFVKYNIGQLGFARLYILHLLPPGFTSFIHWSIGKKNGNPLFPYQSVVLYLQL